MRKINCTVEIKYMSFAIVFFRLQQIDIGYLNGKSKINIQIKH